ncbi:hypothetical protein [Corynebacterium uterequi]|uniref:Bacteriocin biosynthesis cyclodehydratase domain n=1 Tax=Corynebacterium uterequi TaxID=1072256 RepID=A0A0G3HAZ8_9CORY|nr:hypothetical protein [Corynebacterium uterequi]AKK10551.1 hypothetical protein CUTER_02680 [Corynebacterium uterequi]
MSPFLLAPGTRVLVRDDTTLQIGLDTARASIIETPCAQALARSLRSWHRPAPRDAAVEWFHASGLPRPHAAEVFDDLLAAGVLRDASPASVLIVGDSPLATHLSRLLGAAGISVRIPLFRESLTEVLASGGHRRPTVLVDQLHLDDRACLDIVARSPTIVPVSLLDDRGLIGPLRLAGQGACPLCAALHFVRRDPMFHLLNRQAAQNGTGTDDAVAVAATAAAAAGVIHRLLGLGHPALKDVPAPAAGDCCLVTPYEPHASRRFTLAEHPGCPACYAARG